MKAIAENRKARFNYHLEDKMEVGLVLRGTEVKSCRAGKVNLSDGYAAIKGDELFLLNVHISEYSHGNRANHAPRAERKLLLHRKEVDQIIGQIMSGKSFVPLKMYIKNSHIKLLMGIGRGKKLHDKRQDLKKRDAEREIARNFRKGS